MKLAGPYVQSVVAIGVASCVVAGGAGCAARPTVSSLASSAQPTGQSAKTEIASEQKLAAELMAQVEEVLSGAAFVLSDRDRTLLALTVSQAAAATVRQARAAGSRPSPEQLDSLRRAVRQYATDLVSHGNAIAATLPATPTSESQRHVDIQTEKSVKHDDELGDKAVYRRSLGMARLHSSTRDSPPPPNLVCLDPDRVEDLRHRVSSISDDDARTAIPVKALFDSILQTSITLSLPAPSRPGAQPREGRCVSGTTLGALEYLLQAAPRSDSRQRSSLLSTITPRRTSLAPESTHQPDTQSSAGNTASGRKPLLSGLYDLLAPFCPLYPAC